MSCLNSGRRRSASSGVSPVGWKFQNSPWWTSTSCAPSSTARSCSSRARADTPVTTRVTSAAPGHLQAVRAQIVELGRLQQLVERPNDVGYLRHGV